MQSFKRIISILAAVAMLITTLTVTASVSVYAEDTAVQAPVYFTKFTADNFIGYGEYARGEDGFESEEGSTNKTQIQEPKSVTYPCDGAVDITTKSTESKGVRLIYKLDDTAKNYFSQLEDEAEAKYQENVNAAKENAEKLGKEFNVNSVATVYPSVKCRFFVNESVTAIDLDIDALISIAFVLKDGSLTDAIIGGGVKYVTKDITVPIRKKVIVDGETVYRSVDLNDIESVRLEVYHWNSSLKEVTFSGLTVSGTGELPEREAIEVGDENTCVAANWDKNYRRSYAPEPKEFLYSAIENPEGEDGMKSGFNKRGDAGWMKFKTVSANQQYQTAFWFDRDQFDYALALANRKDKNGKLIGSGKFVMSLALESCTDSKGEPVKAEVKVFFSTTHNGYITMSDEWQEPGTTVQYKLDVSQIERSDVEMVIISVQNTWYYDENGELVEYPESGKEVSIDLGNGETSNTIKYGTGVTSVGGIMPQVKVSPITVFDPTAPITTTTTTEETKNDFEYEILSDGTVAITGYTGNGGIVEIPSEIDGKTVTSIGFCAFEFCTSLTSVTIPDTVTSIDFSAFSDCKKLTSITIGNGVTNIGDYAFDGCASLASVIIPESVTSIGDYAFSDCISLTGVTMPDSITKIGISAFDNSALYNDESNWQDGVLYIGNCLISGKLLGEFNEDTFTFDTITEVKGDCTIKAGTKLIADYAFWDCDLLTNITIPDSVASIGASAFEECALLTTVTIPKSVTNIGDYAFGYQYDDEESWEPEKVKNFHINCYAGTAGCSYAINNGFDYTLLYDITYGDANGDGNINMLDVLLIRKYIAKQPVEPNLTASDVTADGNVNMLDVLLIRKYIAKQPVHLGPQK